MSIKRFPLVVILFLFVFAASAQGTEEGLADELYVRSGLEKQMQQMPLMIQAGFDQAVVNDVNLKELPRETIAEMRSLIKESFEPESIKKTILKKITADLVQDDMKKVMEWLNSPLGRRCTKLEEAASTPEAFYEMQVFARKIQESPPSSDRLVLLQNLDSAVGATETSLAIALKIQFAVATAIVTSLPAEEQPSFSTIIGEIERNRPQVEAAVRSQTLLGFLYAYASLTDSELQKYIDFGTSEIGTKYHKVTVSGVEKALLDGSIKWGDSIGALLKDLDKQSEA